MRFFLTPRHASGYLPTAYNSFSQEFSSTRHYQWKEFQSLFTQGKDGMKILDLGCGNGRLSAFLEDQPWNIEYTGIDISKNLLQEARRLFPQKSFYTGSFLHFPEKIGSIAFNQIWAIASFHHLATRSERKQALQNIWNALDTEGVCVMTVWNLWDQKKYIPQKKSAQWRSVLNPYWSMRDFLIPWGTQKTPRYYYAFDLDEIRCLFIESGFVIQDLFLSEGGKNICIRAQKSMNSPSFFVDKIPFSSLSFSKTIQTILQWESEHSFSSHSVPKKIYTPNPEMVMEAKENPSFKKNLQKSDLSLADGNGILWAMGMQGERDRFFLWRWIWGIYSLFCFFCCPKSYPSSLKKTVCGSDVFLAYLKESKAEKHIFLLGGTPGSAESISKKYPEKISGYYEKEVNDVTTPEIISCIQNSKATVVFVALGAPKQEKWIDKYSENLDGVSFCMGVGGSFDFVSGVVPRAPQWMRRNRIEWLYRLWKEPSRFKRIWNATFRFFISQVM